MSEDKPLHVRVAEALGWTECDDLMGGIPEDLPMWQGVPPSHHGTLMRYPWLGGPDTRLWPVPHYDTDWLATGPLIEKYQLTIGPALMGAWLAEGRGYGAEGETPLIAACDLILALKEAGKLDA